MAAAVFCVILQNYLQHRLGHEFGIASRDAPAAQTAIRYWYSLPTPRSQLTFWKADFMETLPMCRTRFTYGCPDTSYQIWTPHIKFWTPFYSPASWTPHDHLFCALRRACFSSKAIGSLSLRPLSPVRCCPCRRRTPRASGGRRRQGCISPIYL